MVDLNGRKFVEVQIYGKRYLAQIIKVHLFGTLDVELSNGKCFRVSGLQIIK